MVNPHYMKYTFVMRRSLVIRTLPYSLLFIIVISELDLQNLNRTENTENN